MLDSSFDRPTPAQLSEAWNAGVRVWGVYLATKPNVGLAAPWSLADVQVVLDAGYGVVAFASGWDDPVALRQLAEQLGVRLFLDDEDAIRSVGGWEQAWLDAAGAGLYGLRAVHSGITAVAHIMAEYPGFDPAATWDGTPPGTPHGWQWQGTHTEFGLSVDRSWVDDWFGETDMSFTQEDRDILSRVATSLFDGGQSTTYDGQTPVPSAYPNFTTNTLTAINAAVADISARMAQLSTPTVDVNALAQALIPHLPAGVDPQTVAGDVVAALAAKLA